MKPQVPFKGGDEVDALSRRAKRYHVWRAGARKAIKRKHNKRIRREMKAEATDDPTDTR